MIIDEEKLEELVMRAVRRAIRENLDVVDTDTLTKEQVAKLFGVTTRTITTYMQREGLPHRKRGNRAEFRRDEVVAWWRDRGHSVQLKAV